MHEYVMYHVFSVNVPAVVFVLLANKLAIFISFFIPHFMMCIPPIITNNNCINSSQLVILVLISSIKKIMILILFKKN